MDYIYIIAEVRRADGQKHTLEDYEEFDSFWKANYGPGVCGDPPALSADFKEISADCDGYMRFEEEEIVVFAKAHPHLMFNFVVRGDGEPGCETRYLYHGALSEILNEIRYMPNPQVVNWPHDFFPYSEYLKDEKFLHFFGDHVMMALQDMMENTPFVELSKYIFESLGWEEGNEHQMFSAIVGWDINDLIERAKESQKEWEENE